MKRLVIGLLLGIGGSAWAADDLFTSNDHRIAIEVTGRERNQILYEMREFLHGLHNIHHALSHQDMKGVAVEAVPMGKLMERIPGSVYDRLPEGFMQMAIAMQEAFVALAKVPDGPGGMMVAQDHMAEIMTYCSGCHDTYRLEVVPYKASKRPALKEVNPYTPK